MPNVNQRLEVLQRKINDSKLHLAEANGGTQGRVGSYENVDRATT